MLAVVEPSDIQHLVVLGHPGARSFNRALAERYCEAVEACGETAVLRDLYALGFDPLLKPTERPDAPGFEPAPDVQCELDLIRESAVVVLVYPIWFGLPPAVIKGYVDRVLGAGLLARDIKRGAPHPLLQGKRLAILSTSASTRPWLEEQGQWAALCQAFDTYLTTIFSLDGCDHLHFDAVTGDLDGRYFDQALGAVDEHARAICSAQLYQRHRAQIAPLRLATRSLP